MNTGSRSVEQVEISADKFEAHYRRQLSSLVDGELAADEARFMLRRIEHDAELAACQERWQLLGDALRGQACAPAPFDFSHRVQQAIATDIGEHGALPASRPVARGSWRRWRRWGGGAALAASVAAVALFMAREQLPDSTMPEPVIVTTAQLATPVAPITDPVPAAENGTALAATVPAIAVAAARRQEAGRRGSATRSQQSARASAVRLQEPLHAVAAAPSLPVLAPVVPQPGTDPFRSPDTLQARPWPRSVASPGLPQGTFNARFPAPASGGTNFYPFEPRLPLENAGEAGLRELLPRH